MFRHIAEYSSKPCFYVKSIVFYVKSINISHKIEILASDRLISGNFDPLMNNTRILYLTKRLGKYKILSLVRVKITSPWGLQGHKNTFPCGLRPLGKVFLTFWPLGEVIFDPHAGEYFILTRPLGEVYHIRIPRHLVYVWILGVSYVYRVPREYESRVPIFREITDLTIVFTWNWSFFFCQMAVSNAILIH